VLRPPIFSLVHPLISTGFYAKRHFARLAKFMRHGPQPPYYRQTAAVAVVEADAQDWLFAAVREGDLQRVTEALIRGAELDGVDQHGDTALLIACEHSKEQVAEFLIEQGADIEARNNHTSTAIMRAAMKGEAEVVTLLIKHGANASATNRAGISALAFAHSHSHVHSDSRRSFAMIQELMEASGVTLNPVKPSATPAEALASEGSALSAGEGHGGGSALSEFPWQEYYAKTVVAVVAVAVLLAAAALLLAAASGWRRWRAAAAPGKPDKQPAATDTPAQRLERMVECPICFESFGEEQPARVPRILTGCGHTLCAGCVSEMLTKIAGDGRAHKDVECPTCRKVTAVPAGKSVRLPINYSLL